MLVPDTANHQARGLSLVRLKTYITRRQYTRILKNQREEHTDLRKKQNQESGNGGGGDSGGTYQLAKLKRKVENRRSHIADLHKNRREADTS